MKKSPTDAIFKFSNRTKESYVVRIAFPSSIPPPVSLRPISNLQSPSLKSISRLLSRFNICSVLS